MSDARQLGAKALLSRACEASLSLHAGWTTEVPHGDERVPWRFNLCRVDRMTSGGRYPFETGERRPS